MYKQLIEGLAEKSVNKPITYWIREVGPIETNY